VPVRKRAMRVSRYVKEKIAHYSNVRFDNVKISKELNSLIIKSHVRSMKRLKVNINIDKEIATASPFEQKKASAVAPASAAKGAAPKKEEKTAAQPPKQEAKKEAPKAARPAEKKQEAKKDAAPAGSDSNTK